jgi:hypothetical protein
VSIFYKAAFYDRDAFCRVVGVGGYIAEVGYEFGTPVLDQEWCTPTAVAEAARSIIEREGETIELYSRPDVAERQPDYAAERLAGARKKIEWAEALIASVS